MAKEFSICCPRCLSQFHLKQNPQGRKMRCSHCGNSYIYSDEIKQQINDDPLIGASFGACRITKLLASGGMGHVYLAQHTILDIPIAIKILKKEFSQNEEFTQRFYREARIAAKLQHPHIVGVIDCGRANGFDYLSMEYVEGITLRELVHKKAPLSQHRACKCMLQLIDALEHAAACNVIHRDIKPANIMIDPTGNLKLADMGLARSVDLETTDMTITQIGSAIGTPAYMSPEQAIDATHVDLRSDIYSLGASFYFLTTGENPFTGLNQFDLLQKASNEEARSVCEIAPELSPAFDALLRTMMAKKPEERYQSWAEARRAVQQLMGSRDDDNSPAMSSHTAVRDAAKKNSVLIPLLLFTFFILLAMVIYYKRHAVKEFIQPRHALPTLNRPSSF